jgi:hypothetical protein
MFYSDCLCWWDILFTGELLRDDDPRCKLRKINSSISAFIMCIELPINLELHNIFCFQPYNIYSYNNM